MQLSDEDIDQIAIDMRNAAGGIYSTSVREFADAIYALGVERGKAERARYEFICDRCGIRQQSKEQPEGAPF